MAVQNISEKNLSFTESLDTVLQHSDPIIEMQRVEAIFKLSALFSEQIVLSDTQFVDNQGIRDIFLKNQGFQDFLSETAIVGMRPSSSSFSELVDQQIKDKMRFSSFPSKVQRAVENGEIKNIYHLNALYPKLRFEYFIDKLDDIYDNTKNITKVEFQSYPDRVEKSLERAGELGNAGARKLCTELMVRTKEELKLKKIDEPNRSIFHSAIDKSPYSDQSKNIVKRFFVDYEYNKNFWETNGFNCLTHPGREDTDAFRNAYTNVAEEFDKGKYMIKLPSIISEAKLPEDKLRLDDIDFNFLHKLRSDSDNNKRLIKLLTDIRTAKDRDSAIDSLKMYIDFLMLLIEKEYMNKGMKKGRKVSYIVGYIVGGALSADIVDRALSSLIFEIPYPVLSFVIGGAGSVHLSLFITDLIDKKILTPRQNERFREVEQHLRKTDIEEYK